MHYLTTLRAAVQMALQREKERFLAGQGSTVLHDEVHVTLALPDTQILEDGNVNQLY